MPSDSQECGELNLVNFNKDSDVLIVAPEVEVDPDIVTIRIKNLRKPVILKSAGMF
jgi:hypothetical protein